MTHVFVTIRTITPVGMTEVSSRLTGDSLVKYSRTRQSTGESTNFHGIVGVVSIVDCENWL